MKLLNVYFTTYTEIKGFFSFFPFQKRQKVFIKKKRPDDKTNKTKKNKNENWKNLIFHKNHFPKVQFSFTKKKLKKFSKEKNQTFRISNIIFPSKILLFTEYYHYNNTHKLY